MIKEYLLKNKSNYLGKLVYDDVNKQFSFKVNKEINNINLLPIGLYPYGGKDINIKLNSKQIENFLQDRIMPINRFGLESYLHSLDLLKYNVWDIIEKTRAMTFDDYYWLSKENEIFEDMHIRYLSENGKTNNKNFLF